MNRILIDSNLAFTRTALVEDGELNELMFENKGEKSVVGNIYAGRVESIVKGSIWCNNQLTIRAANMFCGIMSIIVCVVLVLKWLKDRKEV